MQRTQLSVSLERLPLKAPFRISGYTFIDVPVAIVTLTREGKRGEGEAAGVYYLDDTPERMHEQLEALRPTIEAGATREDVQQLLPAGGARNALDCALWDLEAKLSGQHVWQLSGIDHAVPRITTFTLGADDPQTVGRSAREVAHARALKLKLSGELDLDIQRIRAARESRNDVWLGVDANQGYDLPKLEKLLPELFEARVQLLEQPLPRGKDADLAGFACPIPIAADESVQGVSELQSLLGRYTVANIKLDKCGGLTEALSMVNEARRLGLQVMVGNMVGTSLAMAPAFVIAQLCDYVDLDGPTFLARDRTPGVHYEGGCVWCPAEAWGNPK